jgi:hypothetical protein
MMAYAEGEGPLLVQVKGPIVVLSRNSPWQTVSDADGFGNEAGIRGVLQC